MCTLDSSLDFLAYLILAKIFTSEPTVYFRLKYMLDTLGMILANILAKIFTSEPSVYFRLKYTLDTLGMILANNMIMLKKCAHLTQVCIFGHIWAKCVFQSGLKYTLEPSVYQNWLQKPESQFLCIKFQISSKKFWEKFRKKFLKIFWKKLGQVSFYTNLSQVCILVWTKIHTWAKCVFQSGLKYTLEPSVY